MNIWNVFNPPLEYMKIYRGNKKKLKRIHEQLQLIDSDVPGYVLRELALKRMLECYNTNEIANIIKFYELI